MNAILLNIRSTNIIFTVTEDLIIHIMPLAVPFQMKETRSENTRKLFMMIS